MFPENSPITTGQITGTGIAVGHNASATVNIIYTHARPAPVSAADLTNAQRLLDSLPFDPIPEVGALPPGSHPVFARNPLFTGRASDLQHLARVFKGENTLAAISQIAAATGLGGIGKTQLAVEFVHRYGRYFAGGVFWVSLASAEDVKRQIAQCGGVAGLQLRADYDTLKLDEQVALVLSEWQNPLPRLLVFDNCESEELLQQWRPLTGGSRVLLTSRKAEWDLTLGVQTLALGVLTRVESVELLRKFRPDLQRFNDLEGLQAIAEELGDLPLALHLAGSYLRRYEAPPAGLLRDLRRPDLLSHPSLTGIAVKISPTGHENHVARTFAISYLRLNSEDALDAVALKALGRAAWFAPGIPIPHDLFKKTLSEIQPELLAEESLRRLAELGLLGADESGAFTLHRLLANFVQRTNPDPDAFNFVAKTAQEESALANEAENPALLRPWVQHLRYIAEEALAHESELSGTLFNALGCQLFMEADYAGARAALEQALQIDAVTFGPDHTIVATRLSNLGLVYRDMGDYARALTVHKRALHIVEIALGPEHAKVALHLNNLGMVFLSTGDYPEALAAFKRALMIDEKVLGHDHLKVAIRLGNIGSVLKDLGDYEGARDAFERALTIDEAAFGHDHPNIAGDLNNLGIVLQDLGDFSGARTAMERALKIWGRHLGPDHPNIAIAFINLAEVLRELGDYAEARTTLEKALPILERQLGPAHPIIATAINNLGSVLAALGDYPTAQAAFERAVKMREATLGRDHPNTGITYWWMGQLAMEAGNLQLARAALEQALDIFERTLGSDHSNTQQVFTDLAALSKEIE